MTEDTKNIVGLDLIKCVEDILFMRVKEEDVKRIYSNSLDLDATLKTCHKIFWRKNPDHSLEIAKRLIADGKVITPSINGEIDGISKENRHKNDHTPWLDVTKGQQFAMKRDVTDPVFADIAPFKPEYKEDGLSNLIPEILAYEKTLQAKDLMNDLGLKQSLGGRAQD